MFRIGFNSAVILQQLIQKTFHTLLLLAGIGGVALAVACLHRGILLLYTNVMQILILALKDYGLTLQQASKAIED
jgi:hypothetical protein